VDAVKQLRVLIDESVVRAYSELVRTPKQSPLSLWERVRVRAFAFKQSTAIQDTL
jgi:phage baseplate assembly protein W